MRCALCSTDMLLHILLITLWTNNLNRNCSNKLSIKACSIWCDWAYFNYRMQFSICCQKLFTELTFSKENSIMPFVLTNTEIFHSCRMHFAKKKKTFHEPEMEHEKYTLKSWKCLGFREEKRPDDRFVHSVLVQTSRK